MIKAHTVKVKNVNAHSPCVLIAHPYPVEVSNCSGYIDVVPVTSCNGTLIHSEEPAFGVGDAHV